MIHDDLVARAKKWLFNKGAAIVITELASAESEIPDAIGFWAYNGYTEVIECKVSRQDFLSEKNKSCFRTKSLMGNRRYYLVPKDLIKEEELRGCFGLLYANPQKIITKREAALFGDSKNWRGEMTLLTSAMRRIKGILPQGVGAKIYSYSPGFRDKNYRANITILEE